MKTTFTALLSAWMPRVSALMVPAAVFLLGLTTVPDVKAAVRSLDHEDATAFTTTVSGDVNWSAISWNEGAFPTGGGDAVEATIAVGADSVIAMDDAATTLARLTLTGSADLTIDSSACTLTAVELDTTDYGGTLTIRGGSWFPSVPAAATFIADGVTMADAVTVDGTMKTENTCVFSSTDNRVPGTLEVVSGTLTYASAGQGITGTLTIDADATLIGTTGDAIAYSGDTLHLNLRGTLRLADGIRWTLKDGAAFDFYAGACLVGTGEAPNGAFDCWRNVNVHTNGDPSVSQVVTVEGAWRCRSDFHVWADAGATIEFKGTGATSNNGGKVTSKGAGTIKVSTDLNQTGTLEIENGTLALNGGVFTTGRTTIDAGGTLAVLAGVYDLTSGYTLNGSLAVSGGTVTVSERSQVTSWTGGTIIIPAGSEGGIAVPAGATLKLRLDAGQAENGYMSTAMLPMGQSITFILPDSTEVAGNGAEYLPIGDVVPPWATGENANLIRNGGFEVNSGTGSENYRFVWQVADNYSTMITNWYMVEPGYGGVGYARKPSYCLAADAQIVDDYAGFVQGEANLCQNFRAGTTAWLSFRLGARPGYGGNPLTVYVVADGVRKQVYRIDSVTSETGETVTGVRVPASDTTRTLIFSGDKGDRMIWIDDVAVVPFVEYLDRGAVGHGTTNAVATGYTLVDSRTSSFADGGTYVVHGEVTRNGTITVEGAAKLILCDGAKLTVTGDDGGDGIRIASGGSLAIRGQREGTGVLEATGGEGAAGIGGEGALTVVDFLGVRAGGGADPAELRPRDDDSGLVTLGGERYCVVASVPIGYRDWDEARHALTDAVCTGYVFVTPFTDVFEDGVTYVVRDEITRNGTITVTGAARLILLDEAKLVVTGDYSCAGIGVASGNSLTICGQTDGTGVLEATGGEDGAGIGGGSGKAGGTVTVNGGSVTATGSEGAAGIGGGYSGDGGTVTMNGGTVMAIGGENVAGIGGGICGAAMGTLTTARGILVTVGAYENGMSELPRGADGKFVLYPMRYYLSRSGLLTFVEPPVIVDGGEVHFAVRCSDAIDMNFFRVECSTNLVDWTQISRGDTQVEESGEDDVYLVAVPRPEGDAVFFQAKAKLK